MKHFKGYLLSIHDKWFSIKSITKSMTSNTYKYELVELQKADFIINYDPIYLNETHAKNLQNQFNARSNSLYGYHCSRLYGVNDNLTSLTII